MSGYGSDRAAISADYDVTEKTVVNWLKRRGLYVPIRNCGANRLNAGKACEIRESRRAGATVAELASRYGVTATTIGRVLNNVTYRSREVADVTVVYNHCPESGVRGG